MQALVLLLPIIAAALVLWYIGGPKNLPAALAAFFHRLRVGFSLLFVLAAAVLSFALLVGGFAALAFGQFSVAIAAWSIMVMLFVAAAALMRTRSAIRRSNLFGDAHFCDEAETAALDLFGNSGKSR